MSNLDWSDGSKRVGRKSRHGAKSPSKTPYARKRLPSTYDQDRSRERRIKINKMRLQDLLALYEDE